MDDFISNHLGKRAWTPNNLDENFGPSSNKRFHLVSDAIHQTSESHPTSLKSLPNCNIDHMDPLCERNSTLFVADSSTRDLEPDLMDLRTSGASVDGYIDAWMSDIGIGAYDTSHSPVALMGEEICFGMLPGVLVRFKNGVDSAMFISECDPSILDTDLTFLENHCELVTSSGQALGVLNMKSYRVFLKLKQEIHLRFLGSIDCSACLRNDEAAESNSIQQQCSIPVLVFGFRSQAQKAAVSLAANKLYLQDPDRLPEDFTYENPQCIDLPIITYHEPSMSNAMNIQKDVNAHMSKMIQSGEGEIDFDKFLDLFACQNVLVQAPEVAQVSTKLYSHQREGLGFIFQREMSTSPLSRTLWEQLPAEQADTELSTFRHIITGARSPDVKECLGGVIADEMGLGKSLTMLSAIIGSMNRALTYAQTMTKFGTPGKDVIAAKSTLIIVPSTLLIDTWIDEIKLRIAPDTISYYKFHGYSRKIDYPRLLQHDVVLTTYGTVAADFNRNRSLLHAINWYRIVLDEAHVIRNASTKQFGAVAALQSLLRWALTGTPIQNCLDDLGSLAKFLRVPILEDATQFKRHVAGPIERRNQNDSKSYKNLSVLLNSMCLRRTRAVLPLAGIIEDTRLLDMSPEERAEYSRIEHICKEALNMAVSGFKVKEAHKTVLETLLRLRMFCNIGRACQSSALSGSLPQRLDEVLSLLQQNGEADCYYCSCDITFLPNTAKNASTFLTACQRLVCSDCVPVWEQAALKGTLCPICKSGHSMENLVVFDEMSAPTPTNYPTKIVALCKDIAVHKDDGKCIVFSFWKRSLDIAGALLETHKTPYVRVDGSLSLSKRRKILAQFQEQADLPVLMITLGTGAVGLNNLSVANRVHILEPQWNPSVEKQAIGRVMRLGQEKPVTVVRYIMKKTVEKNVQDKQFRKLALASGGFSLKRKEDVLTRMQALQSLIIQED